MREYEIMLIVPAEADDKVIGAVTDRMAQLLSERGGGRITNVNRWGRRRFAYPIDKQTEGFYLVVEFETEPAALKELERVLHLADEVVRFKVVARPERARPKAPAEAVPPEPAAEAAEVAEVAEPGGEAARVSPSGAV